MAVDITTLVTELKADVAKADSFVDLADSFADKYAKVIEQLAGAKLSPEIVEFVAILDKVTKGLDELQAVVSKLNA